MTGLLNSFISFGGGGGGGGPTPPAGAVAYASFVDNFFYSRGAEVAAADIMSGINLADVNEDGLKLGTGNWPKMIGDMFTDFTGLLAVGGVTVEVEFTIDSKSDIGAGTVYSTGPVMQIMDGTNANTTVNAIYADIYDGYHLYVGDSNDLTEVGGTVNTTVSAGIERRAFTLFEDIGGGSWRTASTTNGGPAQSTTTTHSGGYFTVVEIDIFTVEDWSYYLQNARVRSIAIFPAKTTAQIDADTDIGDWPSWAGFTTNSSGADATSHPVSPPAANVGDMIVVLAAFDGTPTIGISAGTGWTIGDQQISNGACVGVWLWKIATGSDSLTLSSSSSEKMSYVTMSYPHATSIEGGYVIGNGANAQSPGFSPGGGDGKYAFLSVVCTDGSAGSPSSGPANTNRFIRQVGSADGASVYLADKWLDGTSFAPDAWTTTAQEWVGFTLALKV
ncbi:hypothetical protein [Mesorhizobium sp. M1B.F.Ca.ET.045.04.1.1]|uniref:hypothetical protein n=1 Tax=Mesorhizobium sp. M1B.F.Ca.ET.045.04.1.1 TaxID=2493673 RepID=UPI000F75B5CF|nr:hypothetical protein [Mesorhizobium sp. M1B.F.Ca.ET.045.04.1.1]AZO29436.1 hypothetical protein EJ071_19925 [Mesorhizobium sp. M1B.F.Ca.ET.045.04.1.1]